MGLDLHAVPDLLEALRDDPIAGLDAVADHPERPVPRSHLDGSDLHDVVGLHDGDLVAPLDLLHGPLGDDERAEQVLGHGPDAGELSGTKEVVGVGEERFDLDGAGLRFDLPVHGRRLALVRKDVAVGEDQLERGRGAVVAGPAEVLDAVGEFKVLLLADREVDLDRVDL